MDALQNGEYGTFKLLSDDKTPGLLSQAKTRISMPCLIGPAFLDRKHNLQDAKPDTVLSDELDPSMLLHINQRLKN